MQRISLGRSELTIHPLVFGTLSMGPLQANLTPVGATGGFVTLC